MGSDVDQMISDIQDAARIPPHNGGVELNEWEEGFIDSLADQRAEKKSLSEAQVEKLVQIWEKI